MIFLIITTKKELRDGQLTPVNGNTYVIRNLQESDRGRILSDVFPEVSSLIEHSTENSEEIISQRMFSPDDIEFWAPPINITYVNEIDRWVAIQMVEKKYDDNMPDQFTYMAYSWDMKPGGVIEGMQCEAKLKTGEVMSCDRARKYVEFMSE